jgi:PPOX class probable F420-dependent enzyme
LQLPDSARKLIEAGTQAHLVTHNSDGSRQVTLVRIDLAGDDIVAAHLYESKKVRNIRRHGRVAVSFESDTRSDLGLAEYLVVYGQTRIEEVGGLAPRQQLAEVYLRSGVKFPTMDDPPPGFITRIQVEYISGVGPWTDRPAGPRKTATGTVN